jgi:hypothetical protein
MWETPATTCAMMLLASSSVNFPSLEILLKNERGSNL